MGAYVGLAAIVAIAVLTGWPLFKGLRTGVIHSQRVGYSRNGDPSSFWFYACCYAVGFIASTGLLAFIATQALLAR
jgi:hypothetical protein